MKKEQCTMGTRVARIYPYISYKYANIAFGYIAGEISTSEDYDMDTGTSGDVVIVQWEERYTRQAWDGTDGPDVIRRTHIEQCPIHELVTEEEGLKAQALIKEKEDALEARFNAVKATVGAKLEQAAQLIREANELVPKGDFHRKLHDMHEECKPLLSAMIESGWRIITYR